MSRLAAADRPTAPAPGRRRASHRRSVYVLAALVVALGITRLAFRLWVPEAGVWVGIGPPGAGVYALAADPSDPSQVYVGTTQALLRGSLQGGDWQPIGPPGFSGFVHAISVRLAELAIATDQGAFLSRDRGHSWSKLAGVPGTEEAFWISLDPGGALWAGTRSGLYVSDDGGQSWRQASAELGALAVYGAASAADTAPPDYLATNHGLFGRDSGGHWTPLGAAVAGQVVHAVAVGPGEPAVLYVAVGGPGGGLLHSTDGGQSWASADLPSEDALVVQVDPRQPDVVYGGLAGLADGVHIAGPVRSEDAGRTWTSITQTLVNTSVPALLANAGEPGVLVAGTGDGGAFRYREPTLLTRSARASATPLEVFELGLLGLLLARLAVRAGRPLRRSRAAARGLGRRAL